jgi:hypothetical protein
VLRWAEIMALPYEYVLTKLIMNKTQKAFEKRYQELSDARRERNKPAAKPKGRRAEK